MSGLGGGWSGLRGEGSDPPPRWLLLRSVRILLECILVPDKFQKVHLLDFVCSNFGFR